MADSKHSEYESLRAAISAGNPANGYVFHGEERYLLENALGELRRILLPDGMDGFNYHRLSGGETSAETIRSAVTTFPVFAERTLVEIWDYAFPAAKKQSGDQGGETAVLTELLSNLPEHVCLIFVYDTVEWKPDRRLKSTAELLKHLRVVEFSAPSPSELVKWIKRHFKSRGRDISSADAEHLIFLSGGLMTPLLREIEKLASRRADGTVTRADIDEMVVPSPEAKIYNLTDAIAERKYGAALRILDEIAGTGEPEQVIIAALSRQVRKMYLAKLYQEEKRGLSAFMSDAEIKYDWQAKRLNQSVQRISAERCRRMVLLCGECAFKLNSGGGAEELTALLLRLAV